MRSAVVERGVLVEHLLQQLAQRGPRFHPQLLDQRRAGGLKNARGVPLASAAVQGDHQLNGERLVQRVLGQHSLQLGHHLSVSAERKLGVEAGLERDEPQLLESGGLGAGERLEHKIGKRRAAPQAERLPQRRGRGRGIARQRLPSLSGQAFKTRDIERLAVDIQYVAGRAGHQQAVPRARPLGIERATKRGYARLQRIRGVSRRALAPQRVDQPIGRDDLADVQQQHRQKRLAPGAAEGKLPPATPNLQRTQKPKLDRCHRPRPQHQAYRPPPP